MRRRKNGEMIEVSVTVSSIRHENGRIVGASAIARDISERRRTEAKLEYLANHDGLTGLFNRRRFEEELTAACLRAARDDADGALLLFDLDNFKYVNDTFGHRAGDELLTGVANALRSRVRGTDTLARLGGDEFAVLASQCTIAEARRLGAELLKVVREHSMTVDSQPIRTTASVGVVPFDGETDAIDVLADADRAMYESKDAGRDRTTVHSHEQRRQSRDRMGVSWENQIRAALDEDRFELYCQPILNLRTGDTNQAELLLRMRCNGSLVLPGTFLPAAERSGLIHPVDRWVIARSAEAAAEHPEMRFELNISGRTTDDEALTEFVAAQISRSGADPAQLVFELTETAAIGNIGRARELARSLAALGCTFAIDDFGAGFSTFYYLKHFPAQYLKIDGDFVRAPRSPTDELVIESIVRIAGDLGKQTVAEFVGDAETLERMAQLGVDYAQGFHIAEPFPLTELARRRATVAAG